MLHQDYAIQTNRDEVEFPHFELRNLHSIQPICHNSVIKKYQGVFEEDADQPVNIVGKDYRLLQHEEVYDTFANFLDNPENFDGSPPEREEHITFSDNKSKMSVIFKMPALSVKYYSAFSEKHMERNFFVILRHGVDGDWGLTTGVGLMDFACANMEMGGEWSLFNAKHTSRLNLADYLGAQHNYLKSFNTLKDLHQHQLSTHITDRETQDFLLSVPSWNKQLCDEEGRKLEHPDGSPHIELNKAGDAIWRQWEFESRDKSSNLFALSSALTYWASHDSDEFPVRMRGGEKNTLGILQKRQHFVKDLMQHKPFVS